MIRRVLKKYYNIGMNSLPPRLVTHLQFLRYHGRLARLKNPQTLNDHLAARKLAWTTADMRPVILSDKIAVKDFVTTALGPGWVAPILWQGTDLADCPPLPFPYVIKMNHGSERNIFVFEQKDLAGAREKCAEWLKGGTPRRLAEEWYNHIEPRIFVEPFFGLDGQAPIDYKFFCFGNQIPCIQVDTNRFGDHKRCFYDSSWNKLDFGHYYPLETADLPRPKHLDAMLDAARTLVKGFEFVRIDFYDLPTGALFGEMTFCPTSGFGAFRPPEIDDWLGAFWKRAQSEAAGVNQA